VDFIADFLESEFSPITFLAFLDTLVLICICRYYLARLITKSTPVGKVKRPYNLEWS
jgi:hypothetical protein